jgi:hypothetical protein
MGSTFDLSCEQLTKRYLRFMELRDGQTMIDINTANKFADLVLGPEL